MKFNISIYQQVLLIFVYALFVSCQQETKIDKAVNAIEVSLKIERFDKLFASLKPEGFQELKHKYPFMFSSEFDDAFWIGRINDTIQQELSAEVEAAFPDLNAEALELELFFKHLKYHYINFNVPRIVTTTSFVDYRNRVIVTDSIVLISLDNYLGKSHKFYADFPSYVRQKLEPEFMHVDLASEYAKQVIPPYVKKTFLDEIIYHGKLQYFKDVMLPLTNDALRMHYTEADLAWADNNESYIWRYFIDRELLYSTAPDLIARFINPAPFSKFYLTAIDNESPDRLGVYIGWQIVRSYAKQTNASLQQLLAASTEEVFQKSKYKPKQ